MNGDRNDGSVSRSELSRKPPIGVIYVVYKKIKNYEGGKDKRGAYLDIAAFIHSATVCNFTSIVAPRTYPHPHLSFNSSSVL